MSDKNLELEIVLGDITKQPDVSAVVNAANALLAAGGGVCGAIFGKAGPSLIEVCRPLAPIEVGEVVATPAFGLPNDFVIHAVGPRYGIDKPEAVLLANAYKNSLRVAEEIAAPSIAFPALSCGIFGYPVGEASEIALGAVWSMRDALKEVRLVRFVLFDESTQANFARARDRLLT